MAKQDADGLAGRGMQVQAGIAGILDLGIGNVASVSNAVLRAGGKPVIISGMGSAGMDNAGKSMIGKGNAGNDRIGKVSDGKGMISKCDRLIIPGVGSFGAAMRAIRPYEKEVLDFAKSGKPVLGICLGMQIMLGKGFEAGEYDGLGLFEGSVRKMDFAPKLPHVGWARIGREIDGNNGRAGNAIMAGNAEKAGNAKMAGKNVNEVWKGGILDEIEQGEYMYFVHSYACFPEEKGVVQATCSYGRDFAACINKGNVWGVQFHPEKSGKAGARIIRNFLKLQV